MEKCSSIKKTPHLSGKAALDPAPPPVEPPFHHIHGFEPPRAESIGDLLGLGTHENDLSILVQLFQRGDDEGSRLVLDILDVRKASAKGAVTDELWLDQDQAIRSTTGKGRNP